MENQIIISAFEIFSVTKDHWEFCDTLGILTKMLKNEGGDAELESPIKKEEDNKMLEICPDIESLGFKHKEINQLNELYKAGNKILISSVESYKMIKNDEELVENLRLVLKKANK
jgi:hypothetical protein